MPGLAPDAKPSLDTVKKLLEDGKLTITKNTYSVDDLAQQVFQTGAVVDRYGKVLDDAAGTKMTEAIVTCHRLLELGGWAGAEKATLNAEQVEKTAKQAAHRKSLIANRDAFVRLARDKGIDERLFSVNFGTGDASNTLPAAYVFQNLLKKHASKLGDSKLVKEMVAEVEADVAALAQAEIDQEAKKREALEPGSLRVRARYACYAQLLHISRTGFAVFRKNEEVREQFRLAVVHKAATPAVVADDDDAPITVVPGEDPAPTPAGATTPTG